MSRLGKRLLGLFFLFTLASLGATGQGRTGKATAPGLEAGSSQGLQPGNPATVVVSVREVNGEPLDMPAVVKLFSNSMTFNEVAPTQGAATATFANVSPGSYNVEVTAVGHQKVTEQVSVLSAGATYPVYVYVPTEEDKTAERSTGGGTVMTPKLRGEVEKGLNALQKKEYPVAKEWLAKAAKLAPANADILYLLGATEHMMKHLDEARKQYQAALALQPAHERSLLGLGEVQIQEGDAHGAEQTLEKAYQVNGASWRTHLLLGYAYLADKRYDDAKKHAEQAMTLDQTQEASAKVLLGKIAAASGNTAEARSDFQLVVERHPTDPASEDAREGLTRLAPQPAANPQPAEGPNAAANAGPDSGMKAGANSSASNSGAAGLEATPTREPERAWSPPDIDSKQYQTAPGVACPNAQVLGRAQQRMLQVISNFDKFAATEHIVHQQLDAKGIPEETKEKDFWYLVFVHQIKPKGFFLDETRDGDEGVENFPTALATTGLVGLGVAILQPMYQSDFDYQCEGLAMWRGQAAWEIRFEQKAGEASRVRVWRKGGEVYPIALKGRLWISAASYDLLHLETDLREPIRKLQLTKDHLAIDYGSVSFENGKVKMWLPWKAEMYMEVHGRRYHHEHTLTNYQLFTVDTMEKLGKPKTARVKSDTGG